MVEVRKKKKHKKRKEHPMHASCLLSWWKISSSKSLQSTAHKGESRRGKKNVQLWKMWRGLLNSYFNKNKKQQLFSLKLSNTSNATFMVFEWKFFNMFLVGSVC